MSGWKLVITPLGLVYRRQCDGLIMTVAQYQAAQRVLNPSAATL